MENNAGLVVGIIVMVKRVTLSTWTCSVRDPRTTWFSRISWSLFGSTISNFCSIRDFSFFLSLGPRLVLIFSIFCWFKDRNGPNHLVLRQSNLVCGSLCSVVILPMLIVIIQTNIALITVYSHVYFNLIRKLQPGIQIQIQNQIFVVSNAISPDQITDSNSWNIKLEKYGYEKGGCWKGGCDTWNLTIEFKWF